MNALSSAADRERLARIARGVCYGATIKDLGWLVRQTERLLAERDRLLGRKAANPAPPPVPAASAARYEAALQRAWPQGKAKAQRKAKRKPRRASV